MKNVYICYDDMQYSKPRSLITHIQLKLKRSSDFVHADLEIPVSRLQSDVFHVWEFYNKMFMS